MDKFDLEDIKKLTRQKIAISNFQKENYMKNENPYVKLKKQKSILGKTVATAVLCSIFTTGIVFSKDMSNYIYNFYRTGKGVEIAINNGYNAKFNEEYTISNEEIIDLNNNNQGISQDAIKITVDDIVMDDSSLSIEFSLNLSEEIANKIDDEKVMEVNLRDLLITDENQNILFCLDLDRACEILNIKSEVNSSNGDIEYNSLLESNKYFNVGLNNFVLEHKNGNIKLIYNMNLVGQDKFYPRSKKLNFEIGEIDIVNDSDSATGGDLLFYKGNWNFSLDLPENVINRKRNVYKQVNNNEENKVLSCNILSTGTEVKLSLKTDSSFDTTESPQLKLINTMEIEKPTVQIRDWFVDKLMASDEYKKYEEDLNKIYSIEEAYIENEKGEKFEISVGPFANGGGIITEEGFYEPTLVFDLTTNNITEKLKVYLKYLDKECIFELEKEAEV